MCRLWAIAALLICPLASAIAPAADPPGDSPLARRLAPLIDKHAGKVAVAVKHLKSGETFAHQADEPMPTASLIKLAVMIEAYRQAEAGTIDLAAPITLKAEDKVQGSGILTNHFSPGTTISLRDAIRLMIVYSDNTATNLVLDKTSIAAVGEAMEKLGFPSTKIHAKVFRGDTSIAPERSKKFGLGSTTAGEMIAILEQLHAGKLASEVSTKEMLDHLYACDDKRLTKLLPAGTKVAQKTGSVSAVRTVAGIIDTPSGAIAICILTADNQDQRWSDDNAATVLSGKIAREVFDHFVPVERISIRSPGGANGMNSVLRKGDNGSLVQSLQRTLNARSTPSPELSVDGDFGPATEAAVKAFQRSKDLPPSGEVEAATWKALGALIETDAPVPDPEKVNAARLDLQPAEELDGPPLVTCKAWAIADGKTGKLLWSHDADKHLDIASTTKMMTAYLVAQLAAADEKVLDEVVTYSERADKTTGSTADIRAGEQLTVGELLYGLMLPSGNDAAVALAEHFGAKFESGDLRSGAGRGRETRAQQGGNGDNDSLARFVAAMNTQAEKLGMKQTHYANPHGLTAADHRSSAADQLTLAFHVLHSPLLEKIVSTRQHGSRIAGPGGYQRNVLWKNTNRLLAIEGYDGVKTGTTDAAGACLIARGQRGDDALIVAVLGSATSDARYVDARNLFRWAWRERGKR
ncbi:MAG TPA: serine hydrolase [Pirellulaceae bacterium]|nr:serine hydrolase [Pirellulaceae bacterium]